MLSATVIIPTYHRPHDLAVCLGSLLAQSRKPQELIIVDDGALPHIPLAAELEGAGIRLIYRRKEVPGLTRSRNLGISLASGDVIFFLDDDVELFPDYLERIMALFEADPEEEVGGVGGWIVNTPPMTRGRWLRFWLDLLLLNTGMREGRVLPSGFCVDFGTTPFPPSRMAEVEFLPGGASAFRRGVFDLFRFSEAYQGYGLGEDKDFTYRLSRRQRLLLEPAARLHHYVSPQMRFDRRQRGREAILSRHRFFQDYLADRWWHRVAFWWAIGGYLLVRTLIWLVGRKPEHQEQVAGMVEGIGTILRGNGPE